jgi:hypothetical protein
MLVETIAPVEGIGYVFIRDGKVPSVALQGKY